jgi:hypothetical protein
MSETAIKAESSWLWRNWSHLWGWIAAFGRVLKLARFSVFMVLLGAVVLLLVPQGQEAVRGLATPTLQPADILRWVLFILAMIGWAVNAWYCARALTYIVFPGKAPPDEREQFFQRHVPRWLGTLAILVVALALWLAATPYRQPEDAGVRSLLRVMALVCAVLGAGFCYLVHYRRQVLRRWFPDMQSTPRPYGNWGELPGATRFFIVLFLVLGLGFFLLFALFPLHIAPWLGGVTILLIAAGTWIPFGSILVYVSGMHRVPPLLSTAVVLAIVFSLWNDNHALRVLGFDESDARPTVESQAQAWLSQRGSGSYPVFFVAAEGGGIRAAYWSAAVLSALEDGNPGLSEHIFAMSGVSGGALGTSTFAALLAEREAPTPGGCLETGKMLLPCARSVLQHDFLSPALATMFYPDLIQRFLPFPIPAFDRARTLERAWERAWHDEVGSERMAQSMDELWRREPARHVPSLVLNGTSVETGKPWLASNLKITSGEFTEAMDLRGQSAANLPLSTAAHISARFTYLSPAGLVENAKGADLGHVVDGGYFENSGTATLLDVVNAFMRTASKLPDGPRVKPYVIMISNDPAKRTSGCPGNDVEMQARRFLGEVTSPVVTLLNTRSARGTYAEAALLRAVNAYDGRFIPVSLCPGDAPLPLGWMLSRSASNEMDRQLAELISRADGPFAQVRERLSGR